MSPAPSHMPSPLRVALFGATGTIGRAVARALVLEGHDVVCAVRRETIIPGARCVVTDILDPAALSRDVFSDGPLDAVISCLASRTGDAKDAWSIDKDANSIVLECAKRANVPHFVLLSAICVQKPKLAFQNAKRAFEAELQASQMTWSIVRATAYFKSLSGQLDRVRAGRPFLVFGNGTLTTCKPISDDDLARYLVRCLTDSSMQNKVLPIGGPGPAITPMDQVAALSRLLGRPVRVRRVPVAMLSIIVGILSVSGRFHFRAKAKAELARIGRYYATESMLVWDARTQTYDADATPETGSETLFDYYRAVLDGTATVDRGDHAVF